MKKISYIFSLFAFFVINFFVGSHVYAACSAPASCSAGTQAEDYCMCVEDEMGTPAECEEMADCTPCLPKDEAGPPAPGQKWCGDEEPAAAAGTASGTPSGGAAATSKKCKPPECIPLENPLGATTDVNVIFGKVLKAATGIIGSGALAVFVYGGFMWLVSGGNAERVKKGTQAMIWATIGIIVIFSSYAIINLVLKSIGA